MNMHVTVSHGSDFFGVDTIPVKALRDLGVHVRGVLPHADHPPLTAILDTAGQDEHTLDPGHAALLAVLLRRAADHRRLGKPHRQTALQLGIAAAAAAADSQPWTWTLTTGGTAR
ncbi:hypothetical protein ACFXP3_10310 [Streptomyces sp. NPDC059096]|uniref:DUF7739 domain-containing protein n=1 Tax=unclassified Streptomyces TaxID=2593676 RepID=UPI0036B164D4